MADIRASFSPRPWLSRTTLLILLGVCLLALFIPYKISGPDRLREYAEDFVHFPLFALITFVLFRLGSHDRGGLRATARAVLTAFFIMIAVECLQPLTGRTAGMRDVFMGVMGSFAAALFMWLRVGRSFVARGLSVLAGGTLIGLLLVPFVLIISDRQVAGREFPVLASFESHREMGRWNVSQCRAARVPEHSTHGRFAMKIVADHPAEYPGVSLCEVPHALVGLKDLCLDVYLPGRENQNIWIRLDDQYGLPYMERVQREIPLTPGTNHIDLSRSQVERSPGGRKLNLGCLVALTIFFDHPDPGATIYMDNLRVTVAKDGKP